MMDRRKRSFPAEEEGNADDVEMESRKSTLHMLNQERAYTAASRRSDRGLEARYQSALMASEVHKRRTGKSLRITHDIVLNEEMYEEEDNVLSQPRRASPVRIESTATSQADAYIAAIIATSAGVPDFLQQNPGLVASQLAKSMAWSSRTTYEPASDENPAPPLPQEPERAMPEDELDHSYESNTVDMLQQTGDQSSVMTPYFMDAPLFYDVDPGERKLSVTSSISDIPSYGSQFNFEPFSECGSSSTGASSVELDDCLVDLDCDSFFSFAQNGKVVGCE